jgi:peptide deformylase
MEPTNESPPVSPESLAVSPPSQKSRRPLRLIPDVVLAKVCDQPLPDEREIESIVEDMRFWLDETRGVGLAANQIGLLCPLFIAKFKGDIDARVFINPRYSEPLDLTERVRGREGCLSIPRSDVYINRAKSVVLTYIDESGSERTTLFTNFEARIIQHEMDHLEGKLCTHHCSPLVKRLTHKSADKFIRRYLLKNMQNITGDKTYHERTPLKKFSTE